MQRAAPFRHTHPLLLESTKRKTKTALCELHRMHLLYTNEKGGPHVGHWSTVKKKKRLTHTSAHIVHTKDKMQYTKTANSANCSLRDVNDKNRVHPKPKTKTHCFLIVMYTPHRLQQLSHSRIDKLKVRRQPTANNWKFWPSCLRGMPHLVSITINYFQYFRQKACCISAPFCLVQRCAVDTSSSTRSTVRQPVTRDTPKLFTLKHITTSSTSWNLLLSRIITKLKSRPELVARQEPLSFD